MNFRELLDIAPLTFPTLFLQDVSLMEWTCTFPVRRVTTDGHVIKQSRAKPSGGQSRWRHVGITFTWTALTLKTIPTPVNKALHIIREFTSTRAYL